MGKKTKRKIQEADLNNFIHKESDFTFELNTLKSFTDLGFQCEHSGTYRDIVTGKFRQFDIRAENINESTRILLAIECKNISDIAPILAYQVRRRPEEAFHSQVETLYTRNGDGQKVKVDFCVNIKKVTSSESLYSLGASSHVCKHFEQISEEEEHGQKILNKGDDMYEKWDQALHSSFDLIVKEIKFHSAHEGVRSIVVPIVVVPDDRLWSVLFDEKGNQLDKPKKINNFSFYVGRDFDLDRVDNMLAGYCSHTPFTLSHIEFITKSEIPKFYELLKKSLESADTFLS